MGDMTSSVCDVGVHRLSDLCSFWMELLRIFVNMNSLVSELLHVIDTEQEYTTSPIMSLCTYILIERHEVFIIASFNDHLQL